MKTWLASTPLLLLVTASTAVSLVASCSGDPASVEPDGFEPAPVEMGASESVEPAAPAQMVESAPEVNPMDLVPEVAPPVVAEPVPEPKTVEPAASAPAPEQAGMVDPMPAIPEPAAAAPEPAVAAPGTEPVVMAPEPAVPMTEPEPQWVSLFDGESTEGWVAHGNGTALEAVDGELQLNSRANVWVVYHPVVVADFEVEAEIRIPTGRGGRFNSALGFRMNSNNTSKPDGAYEIEVERANVGYTGGLHIVGQAGYVYPNSRQEIAEYNEKTAGLIGYADWVLLRAVVVGSSFKLYVNDKLITDVMHEGRKDGSFGIQHHGHAGGAVRYRNMRYREL